MRLVGLGLLLQRAVAHVLHAQGSGDDQHLAQRAALARLEDHAAHARVERQAGQLAAQRGELLRIVHRAQFGQQLVAVGDGAARGRVEKGEILHPAALALQVQALHAQDHRGQRRAQDLWIGEARAAGVVLLVEQADGDAVRHAPAAAGALVGRRLAHRLDQQLLHLAAVTVALDPRRACVDHILDARHGERGLGHVGGQHDARRAVRLKHAVLLGLRQPRKQRQHIGPAHERAVRQVLAQVVGGLADLALAGQEDQYVATWAADPEFIDRLRDGRVQVELAAFLERPVAHLDRIGAPGNHQHRRLPPFGIGKVLRKAIRVDGGGGDDQLQVRPARQDLLQVAQQEVDVQAALVRLVDDQRVVGFQQRVGLRLGQQDAVGHQLDRGIFRQPVVEAHLVAHHLAQRRAQFLGDAFGHAGGGDTARLRVADQPPALAWPGMVAASAHGQRDLGQLRGLARARFPADDHHLVRRQRRHDVVLARGDGQVVGKLDLERLSRFGHGVRDYPSAVHAARGPGRP